MKSKVMSNCHITDDSFIWKDQHSSHKSSSSFNHGLNCIWFSDPVCPLFFHSVWKHSLIICDWPRMNILVYIQTKDRMNTGGRALNLLPAPPTLPTLHHCCVNSPGSPSCFRRQEMFTSLLFTVITVTFSFN